MFSYTIEEIELSDHNNKIKIYKKVSIFIKNGQHNIIIKPESYYKSIITQNIITLGTYHYNISCNTSEISMDFYKTGDGEGFELNIIIPITEANFNNFKTMIHKINKEMGCL